jgi:hypothetical protein
LASMSGVGPHARDDPILMYPIFRRYDEALALACVVFRSAIETVTYIVSMIVILLYRVDALPGEPCIDSLTLRRPNRVSSLKSHAPRSEAARTHASGPDLKSAEIQRLWTSRRDTPQTRAHGVIYRTL